jgi:hypothetical protein
MSNTNKRPAKPGKAAPLTPEQLKSLASLDATLAKAAMSALDWNPHLAITGWFCRADWVMAADGSPVSDAVWGDFIDIVAGSDLDFATEYTGIMSADDYEDAKRTTKE